MRRDDGGMIDNALTCAVTSIQRNEDFKASSARPTDKGHADRLAKGRDMRKRPPRVRGGLKVEIGFGGREFFTV